MAPAELYSPNNIPSTSSYILPASQTMSPTNQKSNPFDLDRGMSNLSMSTDRVAPRQEVEALSAIRMRHIPVQTTNEDSNSAEDQGYQTAIARFKSSGTAHEAQSVLLGNPSVIIEVMRLSPSGRNHLDQSAYRANSNSSNASSNGQQQSRQPTRFNAMFHSLDSIPGPNGSHAYTNGTSSGRGDVVSPRGTYFPPQSPVDQRQRVSGKEVIGEDGIDEDPTDLLKDPVGYAESDMPSLSRRSTNNNNTRAPARWPGLALATNTTSNPASPPLSNFSPPRNGALQSPSSNAMSPTINLVQNGSFQMPNPHHRGPQYPPVNPADQNPPCNTLYVGNLPIDTSEDELKTLFSKQRGYKRLCFRTKQNGPMCFVEFEDTTFATKTLNELYGFVLHNSTKGGIRLSFSKNPLGVRNGQPGGMGPLSPMSPPGPMSNGVNGGSFSTAHGPPPGLPGPPPGLSSPPGLLNHLNGMNGGVGSPTSMNAAMNIPYGSPASMGGPTSMGFGLPGMNDMRGLPTTNGGAWAQQSQYNPGQHGQYGQTQPGLYNGVPPQGQQGLYRGAVAQPGQQQQHRGAQQAHYGDSRQGQYGGDQQEQHEEYGNGQQEEYGESNQEQHNGGQQGPNNGIQQGSYGYGR